MRLRFDQNRACEKCADANASAEYREAMLGGFHTEWIRRVCSRCGYSWHEDCLDKVESSG